MEEAKSVKVVEVCLVAPPQGTTTSLSLTFFDLLYLRFLPIDNLFFYEFPNPTTTTTSLFYDTIVPNLKHSLSLTLQHFLPLAGTIIWPLHSPHPIINYVPGNAVSLTIAESNNINFDRLCSNTCEASQLCSLTPHLNNSHEEASVMALQVTLLPNHGFSLGVVTHHAVIDGKTSTLFLKAWAYVCSNIVNNNNLTEPSSLPKHLTPFYDRSVINDTKGVVAMYLKYWLNLGGPNNRSMKLLDIGVPMSTESIRGSFELTSSNIQKLKEHANSKAKENNTNITYRFSTFQVTCAYVLQCLVKTEQQKTKDVVFFFPVDCRFRLEPPIPSTYFGNVVASHYKVLAETKNFMGDDGFINALKGINESVKGLDVEVLTSGGMNLSLFMQITKGNKLVSTGWSPRFDVYSIDFGWGRPKKMDIPIAKGGGFCLSDNRNDIGGIEINLVLNRQEMDTFTTHFTEGLKYL